MAAERLLVGIEAMAGAGKTTAAARLLRDAPHACVITAAHLERKHSADGAPLFIDDVTTEPRVLAQVEWTLRARHRNQLRTIFAGRSGIQRLAAALPPGAVELITYPALRLPNDVAAARFAALGVTGAQADALVARCDGWPAAVAFVEAEIRAGIAAQTLVERGDAWTALWMYAGRNVIDALSPDAAADLAAIACTPDATITEFARENGRSLFDAKQRIDELPFVDVDERGRLTASPLVLAIWRIARPAELLKKAQALAALRTQPSAAIATLLRGGDVLGAAQLAERSIEVVPALDAQSHALLAELPQSVLRSYPRLWLGVGMPRWWHDDPNELVESAVAAMQAARRDDIDTRFGLMLVVIGSLVGSGQRDRAAALVDQLAADARASTAAPHHPLLANMIDAAWLTFDEREFDLSAVREACRPLFAAPSMYLLYLLMPLWTWFRIHGRFGDALEASEQAIAAARDMMPGAYLDAIGGAVYTAWLAGEEERLAELLVLHRAQMEAHQLHAAHGFLALAAIGNVASDDVRGYARPWHLAEGLLMRASLREDAASAKRDLEESISISRRIGFREITLTAYLALATFDADNRLAHLRAASAIADEIGTIELHNAIDAMALSDARSGLQYQPVIGYFEHFRREVLGISLAERTIQYEGRTLRLSQQQFAILALIALSTHSLTRRELSELISSDGAMVPESVLEVQLARLRRRLGSDVILHDGHGYCFGVPYTTDWHQAQRALSIARDPAPVRRRLAEIAARVERSYQSATQLRAAESRIAQAIAQFSSR